MQASTNNSSFRNFVQASVLWEEHLLLEQLPKLLPKRQSRQRKKSESAKRKGASYVNAHTNVFSAPRRPGMVAEDVVNDAFAFETPIHPPTPPATTTPDPPFAPTPILEQDLKDILTADGIGVINDVDNRAQCS